MPTIRDELPAAHRRFFPAIYDEPAIAEPRATCSDCAMCPKGSQNAGDLHPGAIAFEPDLKCCTYHPTLPNFLVGAVLSDSSPEIAEGQRRVTARVESRIGITPMWLAPSRKFRVLLDAARGTSFGRSKSLLCPFFVEDGGLCSIWRHREAVCSTFFCKHEAGAAGHAFWTANKQYIAHVETALARVAARAVFPDATEPDFPRMRLTLEDLEDRAPKELDYLACWGEWAGRELDFYRRTFDVVRGLSQGEVDAILAEEPRTEELRRAVEHRYAAIANPKLAERLTKNPEMRVLALENGSRAVTTYSAYDPMSLTPELWAVLDEFRPGETVAETRARLDREQDLEIADDLLLILQNHAILVPPAER